MGVLVVGVVLPLLAIAAPGPAERPPRPGDDVRAAWLSTLHGLASGDPAARARAATVAGDSGAAFFVDPLRAALNDPAPEVRRAAAGALGDLGVPRTSADLFATIDALDAASNDPDPRAAREAVLAMARYPFPAVRRRLAQIAADEARPALVRTAARSATRGLHHVVEPGFDVAEDPDAAARDLDARKGAAEATRRLAEYLAMTSREASRAPSTSASAFRLGVEDRPLLLAARVLLGPDVEAHTAATETVARWSDAEEKRPLLVAALSSKTPRTRLAAARGLAGDPSQGAEEALLARLDDKDVAVRTAIIDGVGERPRAARTLASWLAIEPEAKLRARVANALVDLSEDVVLSTIAAWPEDTSPSALRLAVDVAATKTSSRATSLLADLYVGSTTPSVVQSSADALAVRPDAAVVPPLLVHLERSRAGSSERRRVIDALARRADPRITRALLDLVEAGRVDPFTIRALNGRPEEAVRPKLIELVQSADPRVRAAALDGVKDYRGEDVSSALGRASSMFPADDDVFGQLMVRSSTTTLGPRIALLKSAPHRRHHRRLLLSIEGATDPRIPEAVVEATRIDPKLAPLALKVLQAQEPTGSVDALFSLAADSELDDDDRALAVRRMAALDEPRVESMIRPLANDDALKVRMTARNALHDLEPRTYPSWDPYGRVPLVVEGAAFGAGMMLLAAEIADADLSPAFTGGVGLLLGGATPFLLTLDEDVTLGDAGYFGTMGVWSMGAGYGLGRRLGLDSDETLWLTVAGEAVGLTAGALAMKRVEWGLDEVALANVTAVQSAILAGGITALVRRGAEDRAASALEAGLVGGAVGTASMALLARRLEIEDDIGLVATAMAHGAWLGAWAPALMDEELSASDVAAGAVVGQSIGYLAALGASQFVTLDGSVAAYSGFGAATGAAIFGGLGLALDDAPRSSRVGLLEAGSIAGALTLGIVGPSLQWNENDLAIVALAAIGGAVAGSQISVRLEEDTLDEPGFPGGTLMGAGIGTAAGIVASQLVDVSDRSLTTTLVGGGAVGLGGIGLGYLVPDLDVRARSRVSGAAIALGLALTYPFSDSLSLDGADVAYVTAAASLGGLYGAFVPVYTNDDAAPGSETGGGLAAGAALGGYTAALLSQQLELTEREVALTTFAAIAATTAGAGMGLLVPGTSDRTTVALMQGAGLATFGTMSALLATDVVRVRAKRRDPGSDLVTKVALVSTQGAWQGGLLPFLWSEEPESSEIGGGVMVGASLGGVAGFLLHKLADEPFDGPALVEAMLLSSAGNGLGAGIGLVAEDRRAGAWSMQGLGLATYGTALLLARHTRYDEGAPATFLASAGALGWLGGWAPLLLEDPERSQIFGGALAGSTAGVLGAVALTQLRSERDDLELVLGTATGSGIGAGLGLVFDGADRTTVALLEAGGALGLAAGLFASPYTTYDGGDRALAVYGALAGGALGGFLPGTWRDERTSRDIGGGALFGASLGAVATMTVGQFVTIAPADVGEMAVLTAASGALGGGIAFAADLDARGSAVAMQIAGLGGVALGAVVAPYTSYDLANVAQVAATTGVGALHGGRLSALLDRDDDEARTSGAMIGASTGLLAGALVSQLAPAAPHELGESIAMMLVADAFGAGLGQLAFADDEGARAAIFGGTGIAAYTLGLVVSPYTSYSAEDYGLLALGMSLGAWHGAWLPVAFAEDDAALPEDALLPGAGVGGASGMLAAAIVGQMIDVPFATQGTGVAGWVTGSALGAGLGLLLPDVGRGETIALMEGAGALGFGAALAFADRLHFERGDPVLVTSSALLGATAGLTLPALILDPSEAIEDGPRAGGVLLGAGLGTILGATAAQLVELERDDVLEASVASLAGAATGLGLGLMIPGSDRRGRYALMDGLGIAGLGLGVWLAPKTELDADAAATMALGGAIGGVVGGFTPVLFNGADIDDVPGEQAGGGVLAGAGIGAATGLLLDHTLELDARHREHAIFGTAVGGLAGAGIGLVASEDDRVFSALAPALAVAGAFGVGASARHVEYDAGDLALGSAYVGYLTWHSLGLTLLVDGTNRQAAGVVMGTVGLGALTGMYLTPYIDLSMSDVLMLTAGNVWGTWIGGWGGAVLREQLEEDYSGRRGAGLTLLTSVLGSDVGLAVTGMVVSGLLDVEPTRFAVINLSGLGGMMVGMLAAGFAKDEPLRTGNVVGSLGGLIAGAIVTSFFDWGTSPTWDQILGEDEAATSSAVKAPRGDVGLGIDQWYPGARVEPTEDGGERYLFTIGGTWN